MLKNGLKIGLITAMIATPGLAKDVVGHVGVENIELLQGWRTDAGTHMSAIRITLEDGWKTYWRAPGGNGIPPSFNWEGSKNLDSVKFHWPSPKLFVQLGIRTIGYKDEFILPIEVSPKNADEPVTLKSQVDFGVCSEVCVPVRSHIETELSVNDITNQTEIETALAARPRTAHESNVKTVSCQISSIEDGIYIIAHVAFKDTAPGIQQSVIEYPGPDIWVEQTALENTGSTIVAHAELISFSDNAFVLDQNELRLTLIGENQSIEINGCATPS